MFGFSNTWQPNGIIAPGAVETGALDYKYLPRGKFLILYRINRYYMLHKVFTGAVVLLFLTGLAGCSSGKKKAVSVYNTYPFDTTVINKLPLYDSMAAAILAKQQVLLKLLDTTEAYQAFRYMPAASEKGVFGRLPQEAGIEISRYFDALGKRHIAGFDLFKDSTIKMYIRRLAADTALLEIEENLSFYPEGKNMRTREYPVKDTVLNPHWQYWIRFREPSIFDLNSN